MLVRGLSWIIAAGLPDVEYVLSATGHFRCRLSVIRYGWTQSHKAEHRAQIEFIKCGRVDCLEIDSEVTYFWIIFQNAVCLTTVVSYNLLPVTSSLIVLEWMNCARFLAFPLCLVPIQPFTISFSVCWYAFHGTVLVWARSIYVLFPKVVQPILELH